MNGVLRRLIAWLLALVIGSVVPGAAVVAAAACIYDAQPAARSDVHQFTAAGAGQSQLSLDPPIGSLGLRAVRCLTGSA